LGPKARVLGRQRYLPESATLLTTWENADGSVELLDLMLLPQPDRKPADLRRRIVLRRLHATRGRTRCQLKIEPRWDFDLASACKALNKHTAVFTGGHKLALWCSAPLHAGQHRADADFELAEGQEVWCVFGPEEEARGWTVETAAEWMRRTEE